MSQHPVDPQPGQTYPEYQQTGPQQGGPQQGGYQQPPAGGPTYGTAGAWSGGPQGGWAPSGGAALSPGTERQLVLAAHWSPIASVLLLGFTWIGPLVVYLAGRDRSPAVREHAADALNFQITTWIVMLVLAIVSIPLMLVLVGFALLWLVALVPTIALVVHGVAAVVVATGGQWRYPFTLRLVR